MRSVLDRLGEPDRRLGTVIHVGGTNGKGSTVAMIAALVASSGRRVAAYTSPHLSTLRERIAIAGHYATEDAVVSAATAVSAAGGDDLTFFEQLTAIAMVAIARAGVDVTVLEVGLGGRLDATNVVDADAGVVTGVALDHQAILGDTVEAIAAEKAGIFKLGRVAVIGASGESAAVPVLIAQAHAVGSRVVVVDAAGVARVPALGLVGEHQRRNAAAALAALDALALPYDANVLASVVVPGRFERHGDLIFDGAHNPHAARALAAAVRAQSVRPTLVVAISADKDAAAIVRELSGAVGAVIATRYQQPRSMAASDLAAVCRAAKMWDVEVADDVATAVGRARHRGAPVLVTGSLFVVGEARVAFLGAPTDPIAISDATVRTM